jgi:hypothetical protein
MHAGETSMLRRCKLDCVRVHARCKIGFSCYILEEEAQMIPSHSPALITSHLVRLAPYACSWLIEVTKDIILFFRILPTREQACSRIYTMAGRLHEDPRIVSSYLHALLSRESADRGLSLPCENPSRRDVGHEELFDVKHVGEPCNYIPSACIVKTSVGIRLMALAR